jgi:hypothetical protein
VPYRQTAVGEEDALEGKSTLCRSEHNADRQAMVKPHELLWLHFIEQHDQPPKEIVLDFDGTDIPDTVNSPANSLIAITTTLLLPSVCLLWPSSASKLSAHQ